MKIAGFPKVEKVVVSRRTRTRTRGGGGGRTRTRTRGGRR
jgi:hypothetical protein